MLGLAACALRSVAHVEEEKGWWEPDEIPEGASVFKDWDFNLNFVNWPGMIKVSERSEMLKSANIVWIIPDGIHAVFYTDSLDQEFLIDSLRVRFSGIPGRGPIEIFSDVPKMYLKVHEIKRIE